MKRLVSSDSLGALISMCPTPTSEEHSPRSNHMHSREYQTMLDGLDEEGCIEESGHITAKKRRLSMDQVKALEKYFEVENKLEPERKVKLAQELGLQPRQVAVWFQNRRARWKTKRLERDYGLLKANFDSLKHNYESLQHDKDALLKEIKVLKLKLNEENRESNICVKDEDVMSDSGQQNTKVIEEPISPPPCLDGDAKLMNNEEGVGDFKDGPSESDSSAILNEEINNNNNSPNASNCSCGGGGGIVQNQQEQVLMMSPSSLSLGFNSCSSSINCLSYAEGLGLGSGHNVYQPQLVKLEEHNFFSGEEACDFFSDEAAPTLHWYCPDQWT